jgi:hypothetical protein
MSTDRSASLRTVDLGHEQMLVIDDRPGTRVDVLLGGVWLTEERCWQDRFASAGEWLRVESHGRTVVEAIGPTRVALAEPSDKPPLGLRVRRALRSPAALLVPQLVAAFAALALGLALPEVLGRGSLAAARPAGEADGPRATAASSVAPHALRAERARSG